mmetsp:Transcript_57784/g.179117  ORF Transcript_57784/g.179117 Transcript_57784/m.179117 type:complete len:212 (-) Transcript_57784:1-636(-)
MAGMAWHDMARYGLTWHAMAWPSAASAQRPAAQRPVRKRFRSLRMTRQRGREPRFAGFGMRARGERLAQSHASGCSSGSTLGNRLLGGSESGSGAGSGNRYLTVGARGSTVGRVGATTQVLTGLPCSGVLKKSAFSPPTSDPCEAPAAILLLGLSGAKSVNRGATRPATRSSCARGRKVAARALQNIVALVRERVVGNWLPALRAARAEMA